MIWIDLLGAFRLLLVKFASHIGDFHRKCLIFLITVEDLTFAKEVQAELIASNDRVLVQRVILRQQHLLIEIEDLVRKVVEARLLALVQLRRLDRQWVCDSFDVLQVVEFDFGVLVMHLRVEVQIRALAVEEVLLDHVHRIVVPSCKYADLVRIIRVVLPSLPAWHLQVKPVKHATCIVGPLQLHV